jgi:hypothetical protein
LASGSIHRSPSSRRRRGLLRLLLSVAGLMVMFAAGYWLGEQSLYRQNGFDRSQYLAMKSELIRARETIDTLEADLDVVQTRYAVDRQALEMVRRDIASQKEQIANLEEGIGFYRGLMAPGEIAQGLSLRRPELIPQEEPATYAFRIIAQQDAQKHQLLKGELSAEVFGQLFNQQVSYPLAQLSEDLENNVVALRFRYFQSVEGVLTLPEGFEPQGISIVATVSSPHKSEASERFVWQVQEKFTHVGK